MDNPERPEATNLLSIYMLASGKSKEEVQAECSGMRWGQFKPLLADALVAHLAPLQARYNEVGRWWRWGGGAWGGVLKIERVETANCIGGVVIIIVVVIVERVCTC